MTEESRGISRSPPRSFQAAVPRTDRKAHSASGERRRAVVGSPERRPASGDAEGLQAEKSADRMLRKRHTVWVATWPIRIHAAAQDVLPPASESSDGIPGELGSAGAHARGRLPLRGGGVLAAGPSWRAVQTAQASHDDAL